MSEVLSDPSGSRAVVKWCYTGYFLASWVVLLGGTAAYEAAAEQGIRRAWFYVVLQLAVTATSIGALMTGMLPTLLDSLLSVTAVCAAYATITCSWWLDIADASYASDEVRAARVAAAGAIMCTIGDFGIIISLGHTELRKYLMQLFE